MCIYIYIYMNIRYSVSHFCWNVSFQPVHMSADYKALQNSVLQYSAFRIKFSTEELFPAVSAVHTALPTAVTAVGGDPTCLHTAVAAVHGTWHCLHTAVAAVHGTWYHVPGTGHLVPEGVRYFRYSRY